MRKVIFILIFVFLTGFVASILPYPIFSNHTNITEGDAFAINNQKESEISSANSTSAKILSLDFSDIDVLLPIGAEFELCDIETEQLFSFVRTGGKNHADIEPADEDTFESLSTALEFSWERRPALVKICDTAFLPASLVAYPHGYSKTGTCHGHFCLHFKNSQTDGTQEEDYQHQKAIKKAEAAANSVLELFD